MSIKIRPDGILDPEGKYPNPLTGQPYSKVYLHLAPKWTRLTAWQSRMQILAKMHKASILLLILPTGTGKTVIIPKLLLHYFGYQKRVICTTPRKETTAGAGSYAGKCLDVPIFYTDKEGNDIENKNAKGNESNKYITGNKIVGYKHQGTENKYYDPQQTMLFFATDGTIKAMILGGDRNLDNYGGIIIDEAHERSTTIDIVIALVMDIIPRRPDFKVIIMSATIDKDFFVNYFKRIGQGSNYSFFELPNAPTNFKLDIQSAPLNIDISKLPDIIFKKIDEIILDPKLPIGDILAFVTSESETIKVKQLVDRNLSKYPANNKPYTIAFSASINEKDKYVAITPKSLKGLPNTAEAPQGYSRKVIIGTNAVESSITFGDPLVYVIECGLAFEIKYNAKNYCYDSGKNLVSQASIKQRCGRTGRTNNGSCIRLYSTENFEKLPEFSEPKIRTEDFTTILLEIIKIPDNGNLQKAIGFIHRMIEPVKNYKEFIVRANENLLNMGILDNSGNLTQLGYVCNNFNIFDLKVIKMVIGGYYLGCIDNCVMLGAIITIIKGFEDVFVKPPDMNKNPKLQRQYDNNIKRFIDASGDHITLLKIFSSFYMNPNKPKYCLDNGLNFKVLTNIQKSYADLISQVTRNAQLIKNLNLFSVPQEVLAFGGGNSSGDSSIDNLNQLFGGHIDSSDSDSSDSDSSDSETSYNDSNDSDSNDSDSSDSDSNDSDSSDSDSSDSENDEIYFKNNFTLNNNKDNINTDTSRNDNESKYGNYNKGDIQNIKNDINLPNKNIRKHRELTNQNNKGNKPKRSFKLSTKNKKKHKGHYKSKTISEKGKDNKKHRHTLKSKSKSKSNLMSGGDINNNDKIANRRLKIMNLVELNNLQPRVMMPPKLLVDRILAALYYGYSINRACYSSVGKQYSVKSSPLKGSIEKSSFDYSNKVPDFIVYRDFTVNKVGAKTEQKLSIVSEISSKEFGQFLNLSEIKKKLD